MYLYEQFKDIKLVIRSCKLKNDRQCYGLRKNGQKDKYNELQNTAYKAKY